MEAEILYDAVLELDPTYSEKVSIEEFAEKLTDDEFAATIRELVEIDESTVKKKDDSDSISEEEVTESTTLGETTPTSSESLDETESPSGYQWSTPEETAPTLATDEEVFTTQTAIQEGLPPEPKPEPMSIEDLPAEWTLDAAEAINEYTGISDSDKPLEQLEDEGEKLLEKIELESPKAQAKIKEWGAIYESEEKHKIAESEKLRKEEKQKGEAKEKIRQKSIEESIEFNKDLNDLTIKDMESTEEVLVPALNERYKKYGLIFQETGVGNRILASDAKGNTLDLKVGRGTTKEYQLETLQKFITNHASLDPTFAAADKTAAEKEYIDFMSERGLNGMAIHQAQSDLNGLTKKLEIAERMLQGYVEDGFLDAYSQKDIDAYPDLFVKSSVGGKEMMVPRTDLAEKVATMQEERDKIEDLVGVNFFQDDILVATEDFDVYAAGRRKEVMKKYAETNKEATEAAVAINEESLAFFGKPYQDLREEDMNTIEKREVGRRLYQAQGDAQVLRKTSADLWLDNKTFLDLQQNRAIMDEFDDAWLGAEGVKNEIMKGLNQGSAAQEILLLSMGITDVKNRGDIKEAAESIVRNLMEKEEYGTSRAQHRLNMARGVGQSAKAFFKDPLELGASLFTNSMSSMLPYGWWMVGSGTLGGAVTGGTLGSMGLVAGPTGLITTAGAALAGAAQGFRLSMAAAMFAMEYTNSILDVMREKGYDMMKPEEVAKGLQDHEVWRDGSARGVRRGIPIAVIDYISAGMAGRLFGKGTHITSAAGKKAAVMTTEQVVWGPGMEMVGEAGAQFVAGQNINLKEIMMEGFGSSFGNVSNLGYNTYKMTNKNAKKDYAEGLTDINAVLKDNVNLKDLSNWSANMEMTGQIDAETNAKIQENIGTKRDVKEIMDLSVNTTILGGTFDGRKSANNIKIRLGQLLDAKKQYETKKEVFGPKISDIKKEIQEITSNNKLVEKPIALPNTQTIYKINGKTKTKGQMVRYLAKATPEQLVADDIDMKNAPAHMRERLIEVETKIKENAISEPSTTGVDVRERATDGGTVGKGDTQVSQVTETETQEESQIPTQDTEVSQESEAGKAKVAGKGHTIQYGKDKDGAFKIVDGNRETITDVTYKLETKRLGKLGADLTIDEKTGMTKSFTTTEGTGGQRTKLGEVVAAVETVKDAADIGSKDSYDVVVEDEKSVPKDTAFSWDNLETATEKQLEENLAQSKADLEREQTHKVKGREKWIGPKKRIAKSEGEIRSIEEELGRREQDTKGEARFQVEEDTETFKSTALEGLDKIQQKAATPDQWVKQVQEKGGKGTKAEIEDMGLKEFLDDYQKENNTKSVPKKVVEDYIRENTITIEEVVLKEEGKKAEEDAYDGGRQARAKERGYMDAIDVILMEKDIEVNSQVTEDKYLAIMASDKVSYDEKAELLKRNREVAANKQEGTQYHDYKIPGEQTNYREVLLKTPPKVEKSINELNAEEKSIYETIKKRIKMDVVTKQRLEEIATKEELARLDEIKEEKRAVSDKTFMPPHFTGHTDIAAHVRMSDRKMPNGEKVLFIEEIQSDWAQGGRKKGFKPKKEVLKLSEEVKKLREDLIEESGFPEHNLHYFIQDNPNNPLVKKIEEKENKLRESGFYDSPAFGVPDTPYKDTDKWAGLAVRNILKMAEKEGYDRVAFASGDQIATAVGGEISGQREFYNRILPKIVQKEAQRFDKKSELEIVDFQEGREEVGDVDMQETFVEALTTDVNRLKSQIKKMDERANKVKEIDDRGWIQENEEQLYEEMKNDKTVPVETTILDEQNYEAHTVEEMPLETEVERMEVDEAKIRLEDMESKLLDLKSDLGRGVSSSADIDRQVSIKLTPEAKEKLKSPVPKFQLDEMFDEENDIDEIYEGMKKLPAAELNFTEPSVSQENKVNPVEDSGNIKEKITDEMAQDLGYESKKDLVKPIEFFNGLPMLPGMSDILGAGTTKNSTGGDMVIQGGIKYNTLGKNTDLAWAGVTKTDANLQREEAVQIYDNNKELFHKWWEKYPQYDGLVPLAIMRMSDRAINSNEAVFRWALPTLKQFTKTKRKAALSAFKRQVKQYSNRKIEKNAKKGKNIIAFLRKKKPQTIDEMFEMVMADAKVYAEDKSKALLTLDARGAIFEMIFSTSDKTKADKVASSDVAKALMGNDKAHPLRKNFKADTVYEALGEPSMNKTNPGSVVAIMGIDVMPETTKTIKAKHDNYGWGPKGKLIAFIENPQHGIDVFPEYNVKAGRVAKETKSQKKIASEVGGPFHKGGAFRGMKAKAKVEGKETMTNIDKMVAKLRHAFPTVNVATTQEAFNKVLQEEGIREKKVGGKTILGITKDGKVWINPDAKSLSTPIHEFGHIWTDFLRSEASGKKGTKLLDKGMKLVEGTKAYERALSKYGKYKDGKLINENLVKEEALVELIASKGETIANVAQREEFKSWMNVMYKYIKEYFKGTKELKEASIDALTIDQFKNIALADLFSGKPIDAALAIDKKFDAAKESREAKARMRTTPQPTPQQTEVGNYINEKRDLGYTDADLKAMLRKDFPALTAAQIDESLDVDAGLFYVASTEALFEAINKKLPEALKNIDKGAKSGARILKNIEAALGRFSRAEQRTPIQMRNETLRLLKSIPKYKAATTTQQKELVTQIDDLFGIEEGATLNKRMKELRKQIVQRRQGKGEVKKEQNLLQKIISDLYPEGIPASMKQLMSAIKNLTTENIKSTVDKVQDIANKKIAEMKKEKISAIRKMVKDNAKLKTTKSNRPEGNKRVSAQGQKFFAAAEVIMDALAITDPAKRKIALDMPLIKMGFTPKVIYTQRVAPNGKVIDVAETFYDPADVPSEIADTIESQALGYDLTTQENETLDMIAAHQLLANMDNLDYDQVIKISETLGDLKKDFRQELLANVMDRARKNHKIEQGAIKSVVDNFGDMVMSEDDTYQKINKVEQEAYQEVAIEEFENSNPKQYVDANGKRVEGATEAYITLPPNNEQIKVIKQERTDAQGNALTPKYNIYLLKPEVANDQEMARRNPSLDEKRQQSGIPAALKKMKDDFLKNPVAYINSGIKGKGFSYFQNLNTMMNLMDNVGDFFTKNVSKRLNKMTSDVDAGIVEQFKKMDEIANKVKVSGQTMGTRILGLGMPDKYNTKGLRGILSLDVVRKYHNITMKDGSTQKFTGSQLMRMYALSLNEDVRDKMDTKNKPKDSLTKEGIEQIREVFKETGLLEYVENVVDYLSNEYFETVNDVYKKVNNVSLGHIKNYFPLITDNISGKADAKMLEEGDFFGVFSAQFATALKQRTDTQSGVVIAGQGFFSNLENHFREMEKFKNMAEGVQDLNAALNNKPAQNALKAMGVYDMTRTLINATINPRSMNLSDRTIADNLMNIFINYVLGMKIVQIIKQGSSFGMAFENYRAVKNKGKVGAAIDKTPLGDMADLISFTARMTRILSRPGKYIKRAKALSPSFKLRYENADLYDLESPSGISRSALIEPSHMLEDPIGWLKNTHKRMIRAESWFTKYGDAIGILGYMAVAEQMEEDGATQEQIREGFEDYNETNQTRRTQDLTKAQLQRNFIMRASTTFGSMGFLQMQKTIVGTRNIMRDISQGKIPKKKDVRAVALNAYLGNFIFHMAANSMALLRGNDEDKEKAWARVQEGAMLSMITMGIPMAGAALSGALKVALGADNPFKPSEQVNPYVQFTRRIYKYMNTPEWERDQMEIAVLATGVTTGLNIDPFVGLYEFGKDFVDVKKGKMVNAFEDNTTRDVEDAARLLGYSKTTRPFVYEGEDPKQDMPLSYLKPKKFKLKKRKEEKVEVRKESPAYTQKEESVARKKVEVKQRLIKKIEKKMPKSGGYQQLLPQDLRKWLKKYWR